MSDLQSSLDSHHPYKRLTYDPLISKDYKSLFVFTGTVKVGTPQQTFSFLFDTGSYNLWVRSKECLSTACNGLPAYDPYGSSTFVNLTSSASTIKYVDGTTINGYLALESISLGNITNQNQKFQAATESNDDTATYDGIMGYVL
jgi:hypothetical protein